MKTTDELRWIRPPRQARTHRVLERLLDTTEALLAEKSFDDLSVAEIARRAGSSVGGFYRRFPDKGALLHALHERFDVEARITADTTLDRGRWAGVSLSELIRRVVAFLVQIFRERQGLQRAVFHRGFHDPVFQERTDRLSRYVAEGLTALMLERRAEITHPEPEVAVDVALGQIYAALDHRFIATYGRVELVPLSDERFAAEITRVCLAYLGRGQLETRSTPTPGP